MVLEIFKYSRFSQHYKKYFLNMESYLFSVISCFMDEKEANNKTFILKKYLYYKGYINFDKLYSEIKTRVRLVRNKDSTVFDKTRYIIIQWCCYLDLKLF